MVWRDSRVGEGALFSITDKGVASARSGAPTVSVVASKPTGWNGARPPPATRARPPKPRTPPPPSAWRPPAPSSRPPGAPWPVTRAASEPTRRQAARRTGPRGLGCGASPSETGHRLCETEKSRLRGTEDRSCEARRSPRETENRRGLHRRHDLARKRAGPFTKRPSSARVRRAGRRPSGRRPARGGRRQPPGRVKRVGGRVSDRWRRCGGRGAPACWMDVPVGMIDPVDGTLEWISCWAWIRNKTTGRRLLPTTSLLCRCRVGGVRAAT